MGEKSGIYWISWANAHAQNSKDIETLADPFKERVKAFIKALNEAGAKVEIEAARRDERRAYLFHWSWLIGLGKAKASAAGKKDGVDIEWDHGDDAKSIAGAKEMIAGFGLAIPPKSKVAPALNSKHINGTAVDMTIKWSGTIEVVTKRRPGIIRPFSDEIEGMPLPGYFGNIERKYGLGDTRTLLAPHLVGAIETVSITYMKDANKNYRLHKLGRKFKVIKHLSDEPHWSDTGR
jgi:hypothetical protein